MYIFKIWECHFWIQKKCGLGGGTQGSLGLTSRTGSSRAYAQEDFHLNPKQRPEPPRSTEVSKNWPRTLEWGSWRFFGELRPKKISFELVLDIFVPPTAENIKIT